MLTFSCEGCIFWPFFYRIVSIRDKSRNISVCNFFSYMTTGYQNLWSRNNHDPNTILISIHDSKNRKFSRQICILCRHWTLSEPPCGRNIDHLLFFLLKKRDYVSLSFIATCIVTDFPLVVLVLHSSHSSFDQKYIGTSSLSWSTVKSQQSKKRFLHALASRRIHWCIEQNKTDRPTIDLFGADRVAAAWTNVIETGHYLVLCIVLKLVAAIAVSTRNSVEYTDI